VLPSLEQSEAGSKKIHLTPVPSTNSKTKAVHLEQLRPNSSPKGNKRKTSSRFSQLMCYDMKPELKRLD
jgi:hypothetical protein